MQCNYIILASKNDYHVTLVSLIFPNDLTYKYVMTAVLFLHT